MILWAYVEKKQINLFITGTFTGIDFPHRRKMFDVESGIVWKKYFSGEIILPAVRLFSLHRTFNTLLKTWLKNILSTYSTLTYLLDEKTYALLLSLIFFMRSSTSDFRFGSFSIESVTLDTE